MIEMLDGQPIYGTRHREHSVLMNARLIMVRQIPRFMETEAFADRQVGHQKEERTADPIGDSEAEQAAIQIQRRPESPVARTGLGCDSAAVGVSKRAHSGEIDILKCCITVLRR